MQDEKTTLTDDEVIALADLIETTIFAVIRDDPEIDNFQWLVNIIHAHDKLTERRNKND